MRKQKMKTVKKINSINYNNNIINKSNILSK